MDIRNKLRNFLGNQLENAQNIHIDVSEATTATDEFIKQDCVVREFADDPVPDAEIIESTENIYFSDSDFDASSHELNKLPDILNEDDLDKYRNTLRRQLQAVTREMSKKILNKQSAYVRELDRVIDLEVNLKKATLTANRGRDRLEKANQEIVVSGLDILAKNRRKLLLQKLLESLRFIKTLQQTDVRLKELLQENNYASAIQLCLECQHAAITLHQYKCINELSSNLQELLEHIELQLDVALSRTCVRFVGDDYSKIQDAYKLLGKLQIAVDQLQMHFVSTINTTAVNTVSNVLVEIGKVPQDITYSSLCQSIPLEQFISCLLKLCKNFWDIMHSYNETTHWHETNQDTNEKQDMSFAYDIEYVQKKMEQGKNRVWQDIQHKIKVYVLATNFAYLKYDDFIRVLDIINRLICVGEGFSPTPSYMLQECVRVQTSNYFKAYHRSTLEELRMFLENEVWELCPVKADFTILDMQEFQFMKTRLLFKSSSNPDFTKTTISAKDYDYEKTPFEVEMTSDGDESSYKEDLYDDDDDEDDDDEIADELKQDFVDEKTGENISRHPSKPRRKSENITEHTLIVTNTTLNVLRSFGKYMQMMVVLKPIAFEVLRCMCQLFDYYMYSVFTFFASSQNERLSRISPIDERLKICLSRIHSYMILQEEGGEDLNEESIKITCPQPSPMVDLYNVSKLFGFTQRLIGVESLVFLSKEMRVIYKNLISLVPMNKQAFLGQFYSQTVDVASELRSTVFKTVAEKAMDYNKILTMMSNVRWDPKDIKSQHSPYVDTLVNEYMVLRDKLGELNHVVPIPVECKQSFWSDVIIQTNLLFVDGFSSIKKCTNEGRALMLLDYQQFLMKIDRITNVKPIPKRDYVENYIKAFYLVESELETWLKERQEYTPKQLNNLVTCGTGSHIGKKMKQKMLSLLEELESKSKP